MPTAGSSFFAVSSESPFLANPLWMVRLISAGSFLKAGSSDFASCPNELNPVFSCAAPHRDTSPR